MRERIRLMCGLIALVALTFTLRADDAPAGKYAKVLAALEPWIAQEVEAKKIPALSIALVDDQTTVWTKGFGWQDSGHKMHASADTLFRVGSVSKPFTALLLMMFVELGLIDLDVPIQTYLPEIQPVNKTGKQITLRQMLCHRSGLVRESPVGNYFDDSDPGLAATVKSLNQTELVYTPETTTSYSNVAVATVGYVLERTQKEPFAKIMQRKLLEPLGMTSSGFDPPAKLRERIADSMMWTYHGREFPAPKWDLGMGPAGNLYSSANDMAKLFKFLFARGQGPNGRLLQEKTLEQMWTVQLGKKDDKAGFGLGFFVSEFEGRRRVGHGGRGLRLRHRVRRPARRQARRARLLGQGRVERRHAPHCRHCAPHDARRPCRQAAAEDREDRARCRSTRPEDRGPLRVERQSSRSLRARRPGLALAPALRAQDRAAPPGRRPDHRRRDRLGHEDSSGRRHAHRRQETSTAASPSRSPSRGRRSGKASSASTAPTTTCSTSSKKTANSTRSSSWSSSTRSPRCPRTCFNFPDYGLYHGDRIIFKRDADGVATEVDAATVIFRRRPTLKAGEASASRRESRWTSCAAPPSPPNRRTRRTSSNASPNWWTCRSGSAMKLDIRYATKNNFLGAPLYTSARRSCNGPPPRRWSAPTRSCATQGYGLLIHDAYRPWYVTKMFCDATPEKYHLFVADPLQGSRHNRGCAVDLTLYDLATGKAVEMTGGHDEFSRPLLPRLPRRHVTAALAARPAAPRHGGRRLHRLRGRVVALRLPRLASIPPRQRPLRGHQELSRQVGSLTRGPLLRRSPPVMIGSVVEMLGGLRMFDRRCSGPLPRRDFLKVGSLALGGLGLADVLAGRAAARTTSADTSVILIYCLGGASHLETYDLKPDGPDLMRSVFRPIATRVPGMAICEHLPRHARVADKFTLIRSLQPQDQHPQRRLHHRPHRQGADGARSDLDRHERASRLRHDHQPAARSARRDALPQYVTDPRQPFHMTRPTYLGSAYQAVPTGDPSVPDWKLPLLRLHGDVGRSRIVADCCRTSTSSPPDRSEGGTVASDPFRSRPLTS